MEFLTEAWAWISTNWLELVATATAVVVAAERIAALTPTKKDDNFLAWIKSVFSFIALKKV